MLKLLNSLFKKNKIADRSAPPDIAEHRQPAPSIVVLIDAENVSPINIHPYIKDISKQGTITCIEAIGNATLLESKNWKNSLLLNNVKPCMTLKVKKGKDVADSQIQLRAMELFYEQKPDMTFIISHDSDFSTLVQMLRSKNHNITIILKQNAPLSYLFSTGNIIYEEIIPGINKNKPLQNLPVRRPQQAKVTDPVSLPDLAIKSAPAMKIIKQETRSIKTAAPTKPTCAVIKPVFPMPDQLLINRAYENTAKAPGGSISAGSFNNTLRKFDPEFSVKKYGFNTFKKFLYSLEPDYKVLCTENNGLYILKSSDKVGVLTDA